MRLIRTFKVQGYLSYRSLILKGPVSTPLSGRANSPDKVASDGSMEAIPDSMLSSDTIWGIGSGLKDYILS
jgi:hypothetical protein